VRTQNPEARRLQFSLIRRPMQRECFKPATFSMAKENQPDDEQPWQHERQCEFEDEAGKCRGADCQMAGDGLILNFGLLPTHVATPMDE